MDLSVGGNVFGLDESIKPDLDEVKRRYNDEDMVTGVRDTGGRVSLAIFECKKPVIDSVIAELEPIQKEASQYEKDRELVRSILIEGSEKARESARETLSDVRAAMGLSSW